MLPIERMFGFCRVGRAVLAAALAIVAAAASGYALDVAWLDSALVRDKPAYASYRDVPGVTEAEAAAVDALREKYAGGGDTLVYGALATTEAFAGPHGAVCGFAARVSGYMSELFGIPVKVALYEWNDLIAALESGEAHFTGDLTPNARRRETYVMTGAIANRSVVYYRVAEAEPLSKIAEKRPPRYGFFRDATTGDAVRNTADGNFESVIVTEYDEAYEMLKSGKIDAFFDENTTTSTFSVRDDLVCNVFLPLIYEPVALSARKPEFEPIISVMDKLLQNGGQRYFINLYLFGEREYDIGRFNASLTDAERAFIESRPTVRFGAEYDNYPVSFYNANEREWQGIVFDILREVEAFTGITFEVANDKRVEFGELRRMLENREVSMISELIRSDDRKGKFLWPTTPMLTSRYALISKANRRHVSVREVFNMRVGVQEGTVYAELFQKWFPNHANVVTFTGVYDLYDALERDEIDLVMSSQSLLGLVTNYMERPGYRANLLFEKSFESTMGFNINDSLLCSVVDKALKHIDVTGISEAWIHRTYDYRARLAQSRIPFMAALSGLFLCVIVLLSILFHQKRSAGRRLETLVNKRTEELDRQNKTMDAVTANYKGVILCVNKDRVVTMLRGGYLKYLDPDLPSLVGSSLSDASRKFDYYAGIVEHVEKTFEEGPQSWMSVIMGYTYRSVTTPIYDADGNVTGVTGSVDDITDMVRLSEDLEKALEAAEAASRAKSAFLANMSHEIRTPMNSIIGFAELAMDHDMPEIPRSYVVKILENSKWLLQIINDILDVSKIEAGRATLENIPFDLCDVFAHCQVMSVPKASEKGLALHFYAEPVIGKRLIGDPTKLAQVFINLISNAIKFTMTGLVKVSAVILNAEEGANSDEVTIRFEVRDSGIGMTPEEVKRVFAPFVQADDSVTRKFGGTGLGLSIMKGYVELMGGELAVDSAPGVGSRFSFDIKFKTVDMPDSGAASGAEIESREIEKPAFDGEILVCEDNRMNQEVIRTHLSRIGLRLEIAENGKIGVETVKKRIESGEKMFDLILMDINMPVMDGLEAASKIMELGAGVPIVAMTANIMPNDRELYDKSGMHDCVGKPFTSQELWRCLLRYLKPTVPACGNDGVSAGDIAGDHVGVNDSGAANAVELLYDEDLLLELRTIFVNDNQRKFKEFTDALNCDDYKLAHRLAHTLKSNAGTIGMPALQKAAFNAEQSLRDGKTDIAEETVSALGAELDRALTTLAPFLAKNDDGDADPLAQNADAPQPLDLDGIDFLNELADLLRKGSPESLKFVERIRAVPNCGKLVRQIENFDFDDAFETLREISGKEDIS